MRTRIEAERIIALIKKAPAATLHLIVGGNDRGMVFFCCEQVPLATLQTFGPHKLERCPFCGTKNPLRGETHDSQQGQ
jgi:hypothetical protein